MQEAVGPYIIYPTPQMKTIVGPLLTIIFTPLSSVAQSREIPCTQ